MSLINWLNPVSIIGKTVDAVSEYQQKKKDLELLKTTAKAKIDLAKHNNETKLELSDKEWESVKAAGEESSWKDEYVTLIVTYPIIGIMLGSLINTFFGNDKLLFGTLAGLEELSKLGFDLGTLMYIVVAAAVSIKALNKVGK